MADDALHQYLRTSRAETSRQALRELLDQLARQPALSDEEALEVAYAELHTARCLRQQD